MTDKPVTPPDAATPAILQESDLLKSIKDLETKVEDTTTPVADPVVETAALKKTAADTLKEGASESLTKALDVSESLSEITKLMGSHVDTALETLEKSISNSAERDLAMVRVLADMHKSIGDLTTQVATFGNNAAAPVSQMGTTPAPVTQADILTKSTDTQLPAAPDPAVLRKQISAGLEHMAKSAEKNSPESNRLINAAVKFESTGQIEPLLLREVQSHYAPK